MMDCDNHFLVQCLAVLIRNPQIYFELTGSSLERRKTLQTNRREVTDRRDLVGKQSFNTSSTHPDILSASTPNCDSQHGSQLGMFLPASMTYMCEY